MLSVFALKTKLSEKNAPVSFNDKTEERWKALLIASSGGDSRAYEQFLGETRDYLLKYCRRYLSSDQVVEDCVQNCLMSIHKAKHTWDPGRALGPWFFTIVKRKIIDQYRKSSKNKVVGDSEDLLANVPSGASLDIPEAIRKLVPQIEEINREAFVLTKLRGLSVAETATKLQIGKSAVKVRVHRATKTLKRLIDEDFTGKFV